MKLNPRKLLEDYDLLIWSSLFLSILALWGTLFIIAIVHTVLS